MPYMEREPRAAAEAHSPIERELKGKYTYGTFLASNGTRLETNNSIEHSFNLAPLARVSGMVASELCNPFFPPATSHGIIKTNTHPAQQS